jgi:hypothetical protein
MTSMAAIRGRKGSGEKTMSIRVPMRLPIIP